MNQELEVILDVNAEIRNSIFSMVKLPYIEKGIKESLKIDYSKFKDDISKDSMSIAVFPNKETSVIHTKSLKGHRMNPHSHDSHKQVIVVLEGRCRFIVNGKEYELLAGDVLEIPIGEEHEFIGDEEEPCELLSVFYPKLEGAN